jgi:hypothetical protein
MLDDISAPKDNAVLSTCILETGKDRAIKTLLDQVLDCQEAEVACRSNGQNKQPPCPQL